MAANDELIKLLLDLGRSSQNVQEVVEKLQGLRTTTTNVGQGYDVLERQVGEYDLVEQKATVAIVQQSTALQLLGIELEKQVGLYSVVTAQMNTLGTTMTTARGTGGAGGGAGMGILGASYAFQDFTAVLSGGQGFGRALGAIQNNIPILLAGLGAGAGLAGVVSVVTVGVGLLIDNWDKIQRLWGSGKTEEETKRIKDLAKATEDAAEANNKLLKTLPQWQREGEKNVKRAVDAFGGDAVLKEMIEALKHSQGDFGPEANRDMAKVFLANLQQGDPKAVRALKDLPFRGEVGQVLQGGNTPKEDAAIIEEARRARIKLQDEIFQEKKKKDEEIKAMNDRAKDEAIKMRERMDAAAKKDADTKLREGIAAAQDFARRATKQGRAGPKEEHLPMTNMIEPTRNLQAAMLQNQAQMTQNLSELQQMAREARRIGMQNQQIARQRNQPGANNGGP
jgi:hypothetical protein